MLFALDSDKKLLAEAERQRVCRDYFNLPKEEQDNIHKLME
mgnify:CR=1 FL=1